jgi:hypothetical protein
MTSASRRSLALLLALVLVPRAAAAQEVGVFEVRFDAAVFSKPFSGDLLIAFGPADGRREPRRSLHGWFEPLPALRFAVTDVPSGGSVSVSLADAVAHYPTGLAGASPTEWSVQAIARRSRTGRQAGLDEGDVHSAATAIRYAPAADGVVVLALTEVVAEEPFRETERVRLFERVSPALSEFHGFEYVLRAGVLLPSDYGEEDTYPVVYSVTGFGGTHTSIQRWESMVPPGSPLDDCIVVVPDASNRYGHSVFCDSPSIGPWGAALVRELIPALEEAFGGAGAEHRYVTGVSSGGWSSLWLQVTYPEAFAGCWSHVPDPIDFHDFQQIDLYTPLSDGKPRNMYVDEAGRPRPLARRDGEVRLTYEDFVRKEHVTNPGGQIRSFEATFGLPGPDGEPRRVFDVATGAIDHDAARAWRDYDISHKLLTGWDALAPQLDGKIRIYAGELDTFYLEGAVERFQALAREAGLLEHMVVEVVPGMVHTLHQPGQEDMLRTIAERWARRAEPVGSH